MHESLPGTSHSCTMAPQIRMGNSRMDILPPGHSWPSAHWWLSLSAADQGAWVSGLGAFAAAVVAVALAGAEGRRRKKERRDRARLVAAYLFSPIFQIQQLAVRLAKHCRHYSGVLAGKASIDVHPDAITLLAICDALPPLLKTFSLVDAAFLPGKIGENLAVAIMNINMAMDSVKSSVDLYIDADTHFDPDVERFDAAHGQTMSPEIAEHASRQMEVFLAYCRTEFGNPFTMVKS